MKRLLLVFSVILTTAVAFAGKKDAGKWRVMVPKLEVFESASPDSRVIGSYGKFDCPDVKGPRVHKMIGVNYGNTLGYVFEDGILEPGRMPGSSKSYEAAVEDAIVIQRNEGKIPNGYELKGMYDIWENDNENLPVASEGEIDNSVVIEDIPAEPNENFVPAPDRWQKTLMWIIAIASLMCAYGAIFRFKWSAKVLLIIAIIELLYFILAHNALYFTRFKEFDGGEIRRVLNSGWVYGIFVLQLFSCIRQLSYRNASQTIRILPMLLMLATATVFLFRFGVGAFFIGLLRDTLELTLSLAGLIVVCIVVYAIFKDGMDSKSSSGGGSSGSGERKSDACCRNCIHLDTSTGTFCSKFNSPTDMSGYCSSHIRH